MEKGRLSYDWSLKEFLCGDKEGLIPIGASATVPRGTVVTPFHVEH